MNKNNLLTIFAIFIVGLFLLREIFAYIDFKKIDQNYNAYSIVNNISYESARSEIDNLLILSQLQTPNGEQIENFIILNMISIGYMKKDVILKNANLVMNVYKIQQGEFKPNPIGALAN